MTHTSFTLNLPDWLINWLAERLETQSGNAYHAIEDRMELVVGLARMNIEQRTGGPFAAAIFSDDHRLVSVGVNLVETGNCSVLHAEIVAIMLAQKAVGSYDLDGFELVATTEPCAMCLGAVPWSGVRRLVCGAREEDARAIGFDEGSKMQTWQAALEERGIEVIRDVLRGDAAAVLNEYQRMGGLIYNPA